MIPEVAAHLARAKEILRRAHADIGLLAQEPLKAEDAARNAYYAGFHAAKAFILDRTGLAPQRHGGVHDLFHHLAQAEPSIDHPLRVFLRAAYDFKRVADYDTAASGKITAQDAQRAVQTAERLVATIDALIT
jgi:uncharacterized protein (UPF0332 family)